MFRLSYMISEKFDYWNYLEDKSHFDRLSASIDKSLAEQIAPVSGLLEQGIISTNKGLEQVSGQTAAMASSMDEGFDKLDAGISALGEGIEGVRDATYGVINSIDAMGAKININLEKLEETLKGGFKDTIIELKAITDRLDKLISISKSPEKTWALEQFKIACESYNSNMASHALGFVERAICGNETHTGYPLEFRFHLLLGVILMGDIGRSEIVDIQRAAAAFIQAATLCPEDEKTKLLEAAKNGATCFLILKDYGKAESCLENVKGCSLDMEGFYLLSKILLLQEDDDWKEALKKAIQIEPKVALMAGSDAVFQSNLNNVSLIVEELIKVSSSPYFPVIQKIRANIEQNQSNLATLVAPHEYNIRLVRKRVGDIEGKLSNLTDLRVIKFSAEDLMAKYQGYVDGILDEKKDFQLKVTEIRKRNLELKERYERKSRNTKFPDSNTYRARSSNGNLREAGNTKTSFFGRLSTKFFGKTDVKNEAVQKTKAAETREQRWDAKISSTSTPKPLEIPEYYLEKAEMEWSVEHLS